MNNKGTKEQGFGLEIPDWKRVRIPADVELLATAVVNSAFAVYNELGAGLLEKASEACLSQELRLRGVKHQLQLPVPLNYKGIRVEIGYRGAVVVEEKLLIELKAIDQLLPRSHSASHHLSPAQKISAWPANQFQRGSYQARHPSCPECAALIR
jgi:GxxExxY protein